MAVALAAVLIPPSRLQVPWQAVIFGPVLLTELYCAVTTSTRSPLVRRSVCLIEDLWELLIEVKVRRVHIKGGCLKRQEGPTSLRLLLCLPHMTTQHGLFSMASSRFSMAVSLSRIGCAAAETSATAPAPSRARSTWAAATTVRCARPSGSACFRISFSLSSRTCWFRELASPYVFISKPPARSSSHRCSVWDPITQKLLKLYVVVAPRRLCPRLGLYQGTREPPVAGMQL